MKRFLKFQNEGLIDPDLIHIVGMTNKRTDENKIGEFGSGLKFSLPWTLRNNVTMRIFRGMEEQMITTKAKKGFNYKIIQLNGNDTSLSTGMGPDWKKWYVYRELYSNMLDEGSDKRSVTVIDEENIPDTISETTTTVLLEYEPFMDIHAEWFTKYYMTIIPEEAVPVTRNGVSAFIWPQKKKTAGIFYKSGFMVGDTTDNTSIINFHSDDIKINEVRELERSGLIWAYSNNFFAWKPQQGYEEKFYEMGLKILQTIEKRGLGDLSTNYMSEQEKKDFAKFLADKNIRVVPEFLKDMVREIEALNTEFYTTKDITILTAYNEYTGGSLFVHDTYESKPELVSDTHPMGKTALKVYDHIKTVAPYTTSWPELYVASFKDKSTLGCFDKKENKIVVSNELFSPGSDYYGKDGLYKVLWEEVHHYISGCGDQTRGFQTYLLNSWLQLWKVL